MNFPIFKMVVNHDDDTGVWATALVDEPAIERNWQFFNKQANQQELLEKAERLQKFQTHDEEKRIIAGPMMVADLPIYRNDPENGEYYVYFDAETIDTIVTKFQREGMGASVNLMHDANQTVKGVYLKESFIINREEGKNPPKGFDGLTDGSWFGYFKVDNEEVWNQVKKGTFKGFSVEGVFEMEKEADKDQELIEEIERAIASLNKQGSNHINNKNEIQMKLKDKISAVFEKFGVDNPYEGKFVQAELEDGTVLSIEGETIQEGAAVMVVTDEGEVPAPVGEHVLSDGTRILIEEEGIIAAVVPAGEELDNDEDEFSAVELADEHSITIPEGVSVKEGSVLKVTVEDESKFLSEGEYTDQNENVIVVGEKGKVVEIKAAEADETSELEEAKNTIAILEERVSVLEEAATASQELAEEFKAIRKEFNAHKKAQVEVVKAVQEMSEATPEPTKKTKKTNHRINNKKGGFVYSKTLQNLLND